MRPAGNLAGVEFIDAPQYLRHEVRETWRTIISESGYFFTRAAMRFFDSRVAWETLSNYADGYAFITSEQDTMSSTPRVYTVRAWSETDGVNRLSELGEFATIDQAKRYLKRVAL